MFEQSMVVNSPEMRRRKRFAALLSVVVETAAVGAALTIPLFSGKALPETDPPVGPPTYYAPRQESTELVPPPEPNGPRIQPTIRVLTQPDHIPNGIDRTADKEPVGQPTSDPQLGHPQGWLPAGPNDNDGHMVSILLPPPPPAVVREPPPPAVRLRTSSVMEGLLIRRITPPYPPLARAARVEGTVVLQAMITRNGAIERLQIVSGPPLLCEAAAKAVMQWRYRPYLLNGQPVDVYTEIRVNFVLNN